MSSLLKIRIGSSSYLCKWESKYVVIGGRKYKTAKIGNQIWMAENLDYKFSGLTVRTDTSGLPSGVVAFYYNNDESTYGYQGNKYGLLYGFRAVNYLEENKSTLLPDGWHVPTLEDINELISQCGGRSNGFKLCSQSGWNSGAGTDEFGFNAVPSGTWYGGSHDLGDVSCLASSTLKDNTYNYFLVLRVATDSSITNDFSYPATSIRLVKDIT